MEELREVVFCLKQQKMAIMDYSSREEALEKTKQREGYFHCFGNELLYDETAQCFREIKVGVVEEKGTGRVYHVVPKNICFKNPMK